MKSRKDYTIDELAQITHLANGIYQAEWLTLFGNLDNVPGIRIGFVGAVLEAAEEWGKGQKDEAEARKDG